MEFTINHEEEVMYDFGAKICVIGVGGGGGNAVQTMIDSHLTGVKFVVANTDMQALVKSTAPASNKIQLGKTLTKGLGAGAKPEIGKGAAEESIEEIRDIIDDADMIFVTAGMGGGTGTGAAPVIAKAAREKDILTIGVVTKPFQFEGHKRMTAAEMGIAELTEHVDSLIVVPNTRLLNCGAKNAKMVDMLKKADDVLSSAVRGITDLIKKPGLINSDFADIKTVMQVKGLALMGIGKASGEGRAIEAARAAISSPFLEDLSIQTAQGVVINVTANADIEMNEYAEAVSFITDSLSKETNIIAAMAIDDEAGDELTVTIVATGLATEAAFTAPSPSKNTIQFDAQASRAQEQAPVQRSFRQAAQLNTAYSQDVNMNDRNFPAYLRNMSRTHAPGAQMSTYSDEEKEVPTFFSRQAN